VKLMLALTHLSMRQWLRRVCAFEHRCGTSPEIWLDLQSDYELRVAKRTAWKSVEPKVQTRVA